MPNTPAPTADIAEQFPAGGWAFTPEVAGVFGDHVRASVPFYDAIQDLVTELTDWLVPSGGLVADLGASTGITADRILTRQPGRGIRFALYDEQQPMLDQAATLLDGRAQVAMHCQRVQDPPYRHDRADLTLALFLLQFLPMADRAKVLRMARAASSDTGALVIAEKIRPADARWAEIGNDVSHDWKAAHGIEDSAIRAKARALRGVLMPAPMAALLALIEAGGWQPGEVLFRWHQWVVVGAFATGDGLGPVLSVPGGTLPGFGGPHRPGNPDGQVRIATGPLGEEQSC